MAVKSAVYDYSLYTPDYYLKGFLAGGVCCSVTHGGATPIDFVKTRMQLVPELGSKGLLGATREIIASEGAGALTTGMSATAAAYALQGSFKFGGFEFFKVNLAQAYGDQGAWDNRFLLNSISAACAEFIADIFLWSLGGNQGSASRMRNMMRCAFDGDIDDHEKHLNKVTALLDTNGPDHRDDERRAYQTL